MANIVGLREYQNLARDGQGNVMPVGEEPALKATVLTATGTSAQTTLDENTRFILLHSENIINWHMTPDGNPTAIVAGTGRLAAEQSIFLGVRPGGRDDAGAATPMKIAIIIDT